MHLTVAAKTSSIWGAWFKARIAGVDCSQNGGLLMPVLGGLQSKNLML